MKTISILDANTNAIICEQAVSHRTSEQQCTLISKNLIRKLQKPYASCIVTMHGISFNGMQLVK